MLNDRYVITFTFSGGKTLNHDEYFSTKCLVDYNANKSIFNFISKCDIHQINRQKSGLNGENRKLNDN